MANTKSAKKAIRAEQRKYLQNKSRKTAFREARKEVMDAVKAEDKKKAEASLKTFYKAIDKAAKHNGPLHKNTAARYKAKLMEVVNQAFAS